MPCLSPLTQIFLLVKRVSFFILLYFSTEASRVPLLRALGSDTTGDPERQELLPGVPTAHPGQGPGCGGPAGWRDPHGGILQGGVHQRGERWVTVCYYNYDMGYGPLIKK